MGLFDQLALPWPPSFSRAPVPPAGPPALALDWPDSLPDAGYPINSYRFALGPVDPYELDPEAGDPRRGILPDWSNSAAYNTARSPFPFPLEAGGNPGRADSYGWRWSVPGEVAPPGKYPILGFPPLPPILNLASPLVPRNDPRWTLRSDDLGGWEPGDPSELAPEDRTNPYSVHNIPNPWAELYRHYAATLGAPEILPPSPPSAIDYLVRRHRNSKP